MDNIDFNKFIIHVEDNLLAKDAAQEKCGRGERLWTADMWTIGVAECMKAEIESYNPEVEMYKIYQKDLRLAANFKFSMLKNLRMIKDNADCLFVCEVGRGLDILIAESIKQWNTIYCYDRVNYNSYLTEFFGGRVKFIMSPTRIFDVSKVKENCIMLWNTNTTMEVSKLVGKMGDQIQKYISNDKIKNIILNGEIVK